MAKPKQRYLIYRTVTNDSAAWDGTIDRESTQIGVTWAVSEDQAINNFCYRTGLRRFEVLNEWGDCASFSHITAKLAPNNATSEEQLKINI